MGKSFKSVITVFRDYDNMRTVYTSLPKPKRENTFKDEVMAAKNICVKPAFPFHSLHVLLAMALFVPQFGLVLFSGCSCSSHQGKICTGNNTRLGKIRCSSYLRTRNKADILNKADGWKWKYIAL